MSKNPYLKGNAGLPHGNTWQKNAGHSFQTNQQSLIMSKQANEFLDDMGKTFTIVEKYTDQ